VAGAIAEMMKVGALTRLSEGQRPTGVSPIGEVRKLHSDKFRLVMNMKNANIHIAKKGLKLEGLPDLGDIHENREFLSFI
jgi:hypothetical protein